MADFVYPDAQEIRQINQTFVPRLTANRPIFTIFPIETADEDILRWEQYDNFKGMQQVRGLNGDPPKVQRIGLKSYLMEPGTYGEFAAIDERELTRRRNIGTFGTPVDLADIVMHVNKQLLQRELDRIEYIGWQLAVNGTFSVSNVNGVVMHQDTYANQTFTAAIPWSTYGSSTPLADLRAIQLLSAGLSVDFGAGSTLYMNRIMSNRVLNNQNSNDVAGRRTGGFGTFNSIAEVNGLLTADDLPNIAIYDQGYIDDSGVFQRFLPTGKAILVGKRTDGAALGAYRMTRNATNPGMAPGSYTEVEDSMDAHRPPRRLQVHRGHNGGPVLYFPSAIVSLNI